jgi:UDP-N-acetylglucosamine acyltransferase
MPIHPNAVVDPKAELAADVDVGPFAVIEGPVVIGEGTRIYPNAYISGWTTIGRRCEIHPGAVVGHVPQDFHFGGERSYCRIGDGTIIRECASIHRGTQPESSTELGRECFILGYAHVGHNCLLGDRVKVYNNTALAGHVEVGSDAIISGYCLVHQFGRIGTRVMVGSGSIVVQDIPPFLAYASGHGLFGTNTIGMKRAELPAASIREIGELYRLLFRSGKMFTAALSDAERMATTPEGKHLIAFCRGPSKRGIEHGPAGKRTRGSSDDVRALSPESVEFHDPIA